MHSDKETKVVVHRSQQTILERPAWRNEEFEVDLFSQDATFVVQIFMACKKSSGAVSKEQRKLKESAKSTSK
jgi:hypothetical protein